MSAFVGLDLSLTSTGLARAQSGEVSAWRSQPPLPDGPLGPHERLDFLLAEIADYVAAAACVAVEGPSHGSPGRGQQGHHERGGLWWLVTHDLLYRPGIPFAVVTPSRLKKYATGNGKASKDAVLVAAARRFPDAEITGNDAADALWLACMAADHYGEPPLKMPAASRAALETGAWPALRAIDLVTGVEGR